MRCVLFYLFMFLMYMLLFNLEIFYPGLQIFFLKFISVNFGVDIDLLILNWVVLFFILLGLFVSLVNLCRSWWRFIKYLVLVMLMVMFWMHFMGGS